MNAEFIVGDDKLCINTENSDCNTVEVWCNEFSCWNVIALSDTQLEELRLFLNKWKEGK